MVCVAPGAAVTLDMEEVVVVVVDEDRTGFDVEISATVPEVIGVSALVRGGGAIDITPLVEVTTRPVLLSTTEPELAGVVVELELELAEFVAAGGLPKIVDELVP